MLVVELQNNLSIKEVGGKGYSLRILIENGFNVPRGFVISAEAFFEYLKHNDLMEKINKLTSEINRNNFQEKSKKIKNLALNGKILKEIVSETAKSLERLNTKYVSVRSSAVSEDSFKASFAGLHNTFLNVKSETDLVLEHLKKCWASLFNERAVAYRITKGIPHLEGIAVVIQQMIPAGISGITFTIHPSNEKALLMEASYGLGDIIVSGKIEPDDYVVDREILKVADKRIGNKGRMSICQDGEIKVVDVKGKDKKKQVLSDGRIKEIAKTCLKVEKIFKYPQDIEWCILNDKLWLLQSRAITTVIK